MRNDDNLAHIAHVDGEYKVNMIFYRAMMNAPEAVFYVETSGLTEWRKSVVIRGVYNQRGRGGMRGRGRGRARTVRATKANETEETYLPADSSSSESETNVGNYDVCTNYLINTHNVLFIIFYFTILSLLLQINLTASGRKLPVCARPHMRPGDLLELI